MSNELTTMDAKPHFSLTPTNIDEAFRFAEMLSKASLVPKEYQGQPANCLIAIQWGMEIGLQPLQAMQSIATINGRPAIWGDAMIAIVRSSGLLESIVEDIGEDSATCTVRRRGEADVSRTFTMSDAKRAGLAGKQGPWTQYPKRMLQMRARASALRDVFPDVLRGVSIAEEVQDMPREKNITAEGETLQHDKPSRMEAVKAVLLKQEHKPSTPGIETIELSSVMDAIFAANNLDELEDVAAMAAQLTSEDDKKLARDMWKEKAHSLKKGIDEDGQ